MIKLDDLFYKEMATAYPGNLDLQLIGVLLNVSNESRVYTLSYDSKILSGLFEIFCEPIVRKIADDQGLKIAKSKQNQYPDFTLLQSEKDRRTIAVEIKTTYRRYNKGGIIKKFGFTLGSYRSFLRDPTGKKGILYPYSDYFEHWIIGFLYTRNEECKNVEIKQIIQASNLKPPFYDIDFFVQQKYKIAGKNEGSRNTTNIGSIKSNDINDFKAGKGPFSSMPEFENYWRKF